MHILLYDKQCLICQNFIKIFENQITVQPYQSFEESHSNQINFQKEITLYDIQTKTYLGGVEALAKLLEITGKWPLLKNLLKISLFKPLYIFIYRFIAWHRYSWFIVRPYLRCTACELKIPKIWNIVFFVFFGSIIFISSFFNLFFWLKQMNLVILILFFNSIIFAKSSFAAFALYNKVLGINKIEACKQYFLFSAIVSLGLLIIFFALPFRGLFLALSLFLTEYLIWKRWQQINFVNGKFILIFDCIFKLLLPILIFGFN